MGAVGTGGNTFCSRTPVDGREPRVWTPTTLRDRRHGGTSSGSRPTTSLRQTEYPERLLPSRVMVVVKGSGSDGPDPWRTGHTMYTGVSYRRVAYPLASMGPSRSREGLRFSRGLFPSFRRRHRTHSSLTSVSPTSQFCTSA